MFGAIFRLVFPRLRLGSKDRKARPAGRGRDEVKCASDALVHQVSVWCSGAAGNFGWMREAKVFGSKRKRTDGENLMRSSGTDPSALSSHKTILSFTA